MAFGGKSIWQVTFGDVGNKMGEGGKCCCGCCSIVWFVIMILMLPSSIKQLGQKQIGLVKNSATGSVDLETSYEPGRYWIGFWSEFITFPSTLNTIEFSDEVPEQGVENLAVLETRDNQGRRVYMDISVQYRIIPDKIGLIYKEMTTNYEDIYISALRDGLAKVMNQVSVVQAWEDYTNMNQLMSDRCKDILQPRHAICWGLQVWRVRVTSEYEGALIREQVRKQAQRTEMARLISSQVRAETQVILAEYRKNITIINASGAAEKYQIERAAQAKAEQQLIRAQYDVLTTIRDNVKLDTTVGNSQNLTMNDTDLIQYQKYMMMYDQTEAKMVYAPPNAGYNLRDVKAGMEVNGAGRRLQESDDYEL